MSSTATSFCPRAGLSLPFWTKGFRYPRSGMATTVLRGKQVWVRDPALADEDVFYKGKVISEDEKNVRDTRPAGGPTSCFCPFPRICDLPCLQPGRQNLDPVFCVSGTGHRRITVGQLQHSSLAQGAHSRGASSFSNAFSAVPQCSPVQDKHV